MGIITMEPNIFVQCVAIKVVIFRSPDVASEIID